MAYKRLGNIDQQSPVSDSVAQPDNMVGYAVDSRRREFKADN